MVVQAIMTEAEFAEHFRRQYGLTEADMAEAGLHPAPCECGHTFCTGWRMELPNGARWALDGSIVPTKRRDWE